MTAMNPYTERRMSLKTLIDLLCYQKAAAILIKSYVYGKIYTQEFSSACISGSGIFLIALEQNFQFNAASALAESLKQI